MEKKAIIENIDKFKEDYKTNQLKINITLNEIVSKVGLANKEVKSNQQQIRIQENLVQSFTEKMDKLRLNLLKQNDQMTYRMKEIEKGFSETTQKMEEDVMDLQNKIYEQLEEQSQKFNDLLENSKDMIISEVREEITTGQNKINELKIELNTQNSELLESVERKISRQNQKQEMFILKIENKIQKLMKELSDIKNITFKISVNSKNGNLIQQTLEKDLQNLNVNNVDNAKIFALETMIKEQENEMKIQIKSFKEIIKRLIVSLQQAKLDKDLIKEQSNLNKLKQQINDKLNQSQNFPSIDTQKRNISVESETFILLPKYNASNEIFEEQNKSFQEVQQVISNDLKKLDYSLFDSIFYKRLNHIQKYLEQDPLELEEAKQYFKLLNKPNTNKNLTIISQIKEQPLNESFQGKQLHQRKMSTLDQLRASNQSKIISIENINQRKYGQGAQQIIYHTKLHSQISSPSHTQLKNSILNQTSGQELVDFDQEWKIQETLKKRRNSLTKRLKLNNSLIE